jgi:hypothetical protein
MKVTRRAFGAGGAALLSAACAGALIADPGAPSAARLEADLNGRLVRNPARAAFAVTVFEIGPGGSSGGVEAKAEVRLDWSPGFRVRRFSASAAGPEDTYAALRAAACAEFAGVVPGFDGQDCAA